MSPHYRGPHFFCFLHLLWRVKKLFFHFSLQQQIIHMYIYYKSLQPKMAIPARRHACISKTLRVSHWGLIFWREDGELYCIREGQKKKGMMNLAFVCFPLYCLYKWFLIYNFFHSCLFWPSLVRYSSASSLQTISS